MVEQNISSSNPPEDKPTGMGNGGSQKPPTQSKNNKSQSSGKKGKGKSSDNFKGQRSSSVTWPSKIISACSHPPVKNGVTTRPYTAGNSHLGSIGTGQIVQYILDFTVPCDRDHEYTRSVTSTFKLLKSLTSGARFYNQDTLYFYKYLYRLLLVIAARVTGIIGAAEEEIPEFQNASEYAAFQAGAGALNWNYDSMIRDMPGFYKTLEDMINCLNELPYPEADGENEIFRWLCHSFKDDHGSSTDLISFVPRYIYYLTYTDTTTGSGGTPGTFALGATDSILTDTITTLKGKFDAIIDTMRASIDVNNLMSDLLGTMPSSRKDWLPFIKPHLKYVQLMDDATRTAICSAHCVLGAQLPIVKATSHPGMEMQVSALTGGYVRYSDINVQATASKIIYSTKFGKATELDSYPFTLEYDGDANIIVSSGIVLVNGRHITSVFRASHTAQELSGIATKCQSTTQSDAEDGGKIFALLYARVRALPKISLDEYGGSSSSAGVLGSLLWCCEDIIETNLNDVCDNLHAIFQVQYSTTKIKTDKAR